MDVIKADATQHESVLVLPREDHDALHRGRTAREQAIFRLGQTDMRDSIVAMLNHHAGAIGRGLIASTLRLAAIQVADMEIPNGRAPIENT